MKKYLFFILIFTTGCSKPEQPVVKEQKINQEVEYANQSEQKELQKDQEAIINVLISASKWHLKSFDEWHREDKYRKLNEDILDHISSSPFFTTSFYNGIKKRIEKERPDHYRECFYDYGLGIVLNSFSSDFAKEIKANLVFLSSDTARYTTLYYYVLNDVPYNDEDFAWLSEQGENDEMWRFSVILIKENGEWKIDHLDKYFGKYNNIEKEE